MGVYAHVLLKECLIDGVLSIIHVFRYILDAGVKPVSDKGVQALVFFIGALLHLYKEQI